MLISIVSSGQSITRILQMTLLWMTDYLIPIVTIAAPVAVAVHDSIIITIFTSIVQIIVVVVVMVVVLAHHGTGRHFVRHHARHNQDERHKKELGRHHVLRHDAKANAPQVARQEGQVEKGRVGHLQKLAAAQVAKIIGRTKDDE